MLLNVSLMMTISLKISLRCWPVLTLPWNSYLLETILLGIGPLRLSKMLLFKISPSLNFWSITIQSKETLWNKSLLFVKEIKSSILFNRRTRILFCWRKRSQKHLLKKLYSGPRLMNSRIRLIRQLMRFTSICWMMGIWIWNLKEGKGHKSLFQLLTIILIMHR